MRMISLAGLVLALLIVGWLVRRQVQEVAPTAVQTPAAQGEQMQQQIRQAIDAAMQPRPMPDDAQ